MISFESMSQAFDYYTSRGIIVHPVQKPEQDNSKTGKAPIPAKWQVKDKPYDAKFIEKHVKEGCNIGANCGKASDLTVIDIDYYIKGIFEALFEGANISELVTSQRAETGERKHYFFKYCPEFENGEYQALGFDIRNDKGNIVLAPSVHYSGDIYRLQKDIAERTEIPQSMVENYKTLVKTYSNLKKVLPSCRKPWRELYNNIFENKQSEIYRNVQIFRGSDGRKRHLGLCSEILANCEKNEISDDDGRLVILLLCMMVFENEYDDFHTQKEIRNVSKKPWKNETIANDEYLNQYVNSSTAETKEKSKSKGKEPIVIPEELKSILKKAEEDKITGVPECLKWISENSKVLFTLPRGLLSKEVIDFRAGLFDMPEIIKEIGKVFKIESESLEIIYDKINTINNEYHKEKKRIELTIARINTYPDSVRNKAEQELLTGDPYQFQLNTWRKRHIGDEVVGQTLLACAGSTFITGKNAGLHFKPSGESGKGKTSGVDTYLNQLPPSMIIRGGLSDKYIYYGDDINAGSICFVDDRDLSDNLKEVVKNSISNFQTPEYHRTVIQGRAQKFRAAPRTSWIFASVDGFDDEQIDNRFLKADVDATHEQDERVAEFQRGSEFSDILTSDNEDLKVCQCMYDILSLFTYDIRVPYTEAIIWNHVRNRRNQPKFIDIIRAVCLYKIYQRECIAGCYLADIEDYYRAVEVYKGTATQNNINLTAQEQKILNVFITKNKADGYYKNPLKNQAARLDIEDLMDATGFKRARLLQILEGRKERGTYGMFDKVTQLCKEESDKGRKTLYFYKGNVDFSTFERFTNIKPTEEVEKITENVRLQLQSATVSTVTTENTIKSHIISNCYHLLPSVTKQMVAVESTAVSSKGVLIYNTATINREKRETHIQSQNEEVGSTKNSSSSSLPVEKIFLPLSQTRDFGNSTLNKDKKESTDSETSVTIPLVAGGSSWYQLVAEEREKEPADNESTATTSGKPQQKNTSQLKRNLCEFAVTRYHYIVEDLNQFVSDFLERYPEYQNMPKTLIREFAGYLRKIGWKSGVAEICKTEKSLPFDEMIMKDGKEMEGLDLTGCCQVLLKNHPELYRKSYEDAARSIICLHPGLESKYSKLGIEEAIKQCREEGSTA